MVKIRTALAAAFAACAFAGPVRAEPPMWVVRDADSTIVLFGSVHLLPQALDWRTKALTDAVGAADDLWFEIPVDATTSRKVADLAQQKAYLPSGRTLSAMLDLKSRGRLARLTKALGLQPTQMDRMQPWMVEIQLMVAYLNTKGADAGQGVEETIAAMAPAKAKRRAFESAEAQIAFLSSGSRKTQIASLKESLREIEADPKGFERMLAAWMSGDAKALTREVIDPMIKATPGSYEILVRSRNQDWTGQIINRLKGSGRTVMVVGAGHLVGPDSVPAMLRARGIVVEGP